MRMIRNMNNDLQSQIKKDMLEDGKLSQVRDLYILQDVDAMPRAWCNRTFRSLTCPSLGTASLLLNIRY